MDDLKNSCNDNDRAFCSEGPTKTVLSRQHALHDLTKGLFLESFGRVRVSPDDKHLSNET